MLVLQSWIIPIMKNGGYLNEIGNRENSPRDGKQNTNQGWWKKGTWRLMNWGGGDWDDNRKGSSSFAWDQSYALEQCFLKFSAHTNTQEILWKDRFWFSRWGLRFCIDEKLQGDARGAGPHAAFWIARL